MNIKSQLTLFLALTFALTLKLTLLPYPLANALAQASPALVAIFLILLSKEKKKQIIETGILKSDKISYYTIAVLLPFIAIAFAYSVASKYSLVHFSPWREVSNVT